MQRIDTGAIRILHVDDEPDFAELVSTFLEREHRDFTVETATSASEGEERIADRQFDCIVSDYDMPGDSGIDFLETVRAEYPDLPFILFTGKGSEEIASDAISAGVTEYMQKESGTDQYTVLANRIRNCVEQYRAEREAERYQRRLEELTESTPDCFWMFTSDWEELLYVSGYEQVWNRPVAAIEENPKDFLQSVHPEDRALVEESMVAISNGESMDIEYRILRGDDNQGWVWVKGEPIFDEDGTVVRAVGFTRDITDRKERERELERISDRMEFALRSTKAGIWEWNPETGAITGIPTPCPVLGADCESFGDFLETVHPEDRSRIESVAETALERGESSTVQFRVISDAGPEWAETQIETIENEDGSVSRVIGLIRDITEQKADALELEHRERSLRRIYEVIADCGQPLADQIESLLAITREMIGTDYATFSHIHDDQYEFEAVAVAPEIDLEAGESTDLAHLPFCERVAQMEEPIVINDADTEAPELAGSELGIACYLGAPVTIEDEPYGTFCFYDTDARSQRFTEWEVTVVELLSEFVSSALADQRARTELERQNARLDEFASVVSHDLRSPLNVAEGELELLREQCDSEHGERVGRALDRMGTLIDDLLTLARHGETVTAPDPVDLSAIADACWRNVETVDATLVTEVERTIYADESRLKQVIENLVRNAVEHGGDEVTVTVGELDDGFYVEDDGSGIPENDRDRVFDAGYSRSEAGTGFGLTIVQQVVDAHDWTVRVTDNPDGGARFEITGVQFDTD